MVIKAFKEEREEDVDVTLISESSVAYYSGMLPGFIAGLYDSRDIQIRLAPLCRWAGVEFVERRVVGVDSKRREVVLSADDAANVPEERVLYDVLSMDVGSTSSAHRSPGAGVYAVATRPLNLLDARLGAIEARLGQQLTSEQQPSPPAVRVVVVGSGAAGVELAFAMRARLAARMPGRSVHVLVVGAGVSILPTYPKVRYLSTERLS